MSPDVSELGHRLAAAHYTEENVAALLGVEDVLDATSGQAAYYARRMGDEEPLRTLVSLLLLGRPVGRRQAERVLGHDLLSLLERSGLALGHDSVEAKHLLVPWRGVTVAHDREDRRPLSPDHVVGIGGATSALASLVDRHPTGRALDLGCGCGVQALLAARHSERVTAIDINPRALRFARIGAALSGIANVELVEGDLFDPVREESFDLIVANPPFVISPDTTLAFRDSSLEGDEVSGVVIRDAARHLRDHGFAYVLASWTGERQDPLARVRRWLAGLGCDALVLHLEPDDPLAYAMRWVQYRPGDDERDYEQTIDRWTRYYGKQGIETIVSGAVVLRRRGGGGGWMHAARFNGRPTRRAAAHVARVFAGQDALAADPSDEALLRAVLRLPAPHELAQLLRYDGGEYRAEPVRIVAQDGCGVEPQVSAHVLHLLLRLDGHRPLAELLDEAKQEAGLPDDVLLEEGLRAVRTLLGNGCLEHAHAANPAERLS